MTTKYNKSGKRPWKCFSISFQNKETETGKKLSWKQGLPVVMNNQSTNSGFIETSLLHCQHYPSSKIRRVEIVLKTAATEASCCFILISGTIDEVEMYDTNNKRSLDLSEYKKRRCLNF